MRKFTESFYYITILLVSVYAEDYLDTVSPRSPYTRGRNESQSFSYHVSVLSNTELLCSGAIISDFHILTVAYCVAGGVPKDFLVRAGSDYKKYGGEIYRVCSIKQHESYNWRTQDSDIAILQLCRRLQFSEYIKPIPVEKKRKFLKEGTMAILSGIDQTIESGTTSIKQSKVRIVGHKRCIKVYTPVLNVTDNMICAENKGQDGTCVDKFGGPLVIKNELVGLLSWSNGCQQQKYPGVYTRVVNYYKWIQQNILSI